MLDWYGKYLLGSEDTGSIEGLQVPKCIFKCRSIRGSSKKRPTKNHKTQPSLQTKKGQKLFLLKNCCLCHNNECYQLIPFFHCADNVRLYNACSCKINCLLPALKKAGVGRNNLYPVNQTKSVLTLACPQTLHHHSAFSVDITLV